MNNSGVRTLALLLQMHGHLIKVGVVTCLCYYYAGIMLATFACYYSRKYSRIIISGLPVTYLKVKDGELWRRHVDNVRGSSSDAVPNEGSLPAGITPHPDSTYSAEPEEGTDPPASAVDSSDSAVDTSDSDNSATDVDPLNTSLPETTSAPAPETVKPAVQDLSTTRYPPRNRKPPDRLMWIKQGGV